MIERVRCSIGTTGSDEERLPVVSNAGEEGRCRAVRSRLGLPTVGGGRRLGADRLGSEVAEEEGSL